MGLPTEHGSGAPGAHELREFSRSMADLHWLLLILVLLYYFIPLQPLGDADALIGVMVSYTALVIVFRYLHVFSRETRWKLALETCLMIAFITLALWYTGRVASPLLNLYLLVIIACAMTLGKAMTLLEILLIAICYLFMSYASYGNGLLAAETFTLLMAKFAPFVLVAYVTSLLTADIRAANRRIAILSQTDDLTGLLNLRAFRLMLDREIARAEREAGTFSVIMLDVDELKHVNDRYGHGTGSRLLQAVAAALGNCVRAADILARYGGDEFVILLANTGTQEARAAGERMLEAVSGATLECRGERIQATASIGIATYPDGVGAAGEILDKADLALYCSKHGGRNRVTGYSRSLEPLSAGA